MGLVRKGSPKMSLFESPEAENRSCPYLWNSKVPNLLYLALFLSSSLPFQSPHSLDRPCKKCITSLVLGALRAFEPVLYIAAAEFFYSNRPVYVGTTSASQSEEREQQWLSNKNCGKQYPW